MNKVSENGRKSSWPEYCHEFPESSVAELREGCQPQRLLHPAGADKAIVLVHGLTDSPYFVSALADYFYSTLGYDVYAPLLHCHGLKEPNGMAGVSLARWKSNVHFALHEASQRSTKVAIGGLSTGGALSFYMACTCGEVTGDIYLFSAALGLSRVLFVIPGWLQEWVLRTPITHIVDNGKPLVGNNPYRYARVSLNCAKELSYLIQENKRLRRRYSPQNLLEKRIFAVTTECDEVVSISAVTSLEKIVAPGGFVGYSIAEKEGVEHACVVLEEPIYAVNSRPGEPPLEKANPLFADMVEHIRLFEQNS